MNAVNPIDTTNPVVKFNEKIRVLQDGVHVKYDGESTYEGFKHDVVVLTGEEYPPRLDIHNSDKLQAGVYDVYAEMNTKNKLRSRNHYIFNTEETKKLNK